MSRDVALDRFQNWMQAVITHPLGVAAGVESADAAKWMTVSASEIEALVAPSRRLTGLERLAIYSGMYFPRLHDCLAEDFPALQFALGDEFTATMRRYVTDTPSTSWTLNRLGAALPRWLAERADRIPHGPFLAELARLERAIQEVFDEQEPPGGPLAKPLGADDILALPPQRWSEVRFEFVPALRLLAFDHPVNVYYRAFREGESPSIPAPTRSWLAVYRKDYTVWRVPLDAPQHALLARLRAGDSLGQAIEQAAPEDDDTAAAFVQSLGEWFREWAAEGLFRSATIPH